MTAATPKGKVDTGTEAVPATWSVPRDALGESESETYRNLTETRGCKPPEEEVLVRPETLGFNG